MNSNSQDNGVVKVMVAIPTMGYCASEAYCNRLGGFLHLGRLEEQGKWLHKLASVLKSETPELAESVLRKVMEGESLYYTNSDGKRFIFYFAVIGRIFTPVARDQAAKMALESGCDYLYMIDDDMICPDDLFEKLYKHDKDIVAPLAFTRNYPHKPVMYASIDGYDPVARKEYFRNTVIQKYPRNQLVEVDAVGFGAALIKTWVLRALKEKHNGSSQWFMSTCGTGEDIYFCYQAKKIGARVFMDTATKLGHLGAPINVEEEYVDKIKAREVPDFDKIHGDYTKYQSTNGNHQEAVFVTGE